MQAVSTRKETLRVRVTKTEMKRWRKAARKHAGGNVSHYVRDCVDAVERSQVAPAEVASR